MRKFICVFCMFFTFLSLSVNAATLSDAIQYVMEKKGIEITEDITYVNTLQNRNEIINKPLISSALRSNIIFSKNHVINENSTDFSPLTDAIVRDCTSDDKYRIMTGKISDLEKKNQIVFTDETIFLTPDLSRQDLTLEGLFTCVVASDNKVEFVWSATKFHNPAIYRAKLYWADNEVLIATGLERKAYRFWIKENNQGYVEFDMANENIDSSFVMDNLDKYIYIFADFRDGKYIAYGIGK